MNKSYTTRLIVGTKFIYDEKIGETTSLWQRGIMMFYLYSACTYKLFKIFITSHVVHGMTQ